MNLAISTLADTVIDVASWYPNIKLRPLKLPMPSEEGHGIFDHGLRAARVA